MDKTVRMAEVVVTKPPENLKTVLGSCVAIVLYDWKNNIYGMCHAMLPKSNPDDAKKTPGKFVDSGIDELLKQMNVPKEMAYKFKAKLAGGANMFSKIVTNSSMEIGKANIAVAHDILKSLRIEVTGEDLGGTKGRQLYIDSIEKIVSVCLIGEPKKEI